MSQKKLKSKKPYKVKRWPPIPKPKPTQVKAQFSLESDVPYYTEHPFDPRFIPKDDE